MSWHWQYLWRIIYPMPSFDQAAMRAVQSTLLEHTSWYLYVLNLQSHALTPRTVSVEPCPSTSWFSSSKVPWMGPGVALSPRSWLLPCVLAVEQLYQILGDSYPCPSQSTISWQRWTSLYNPVSSNLCEVVPSLSARLCHALLVQQGVINHMFYVLLCV